MTLKELKNKIYDIINNGDDMMTVEDITDCIIVEILDWYKNKESNIS